MLAAGPSAAQAQLSADKDSPTAKAGHVLRRMTYGPTPDALATLSVGQPDSIEKFIKEQLSPGSITETHPDLAGLISQLNLPTGQVGSWNIDVVSRYQIVRALFSNKQLQEVMTYFWDRHFNTYYLVVRNWFPANGNSLATWFEHRETELFRANAVGTFQEMLVGSATSPAMLIYLDSVNNVAGSPNENYARELFELHTLGVDSVTGDPNLYTEDDIEEAARVFTGWTVCEVSNPDNPHDPCGSGTLWGFHFDNANHDYGAKTIFPGTVHQLDIPARPVGSDKGIEDGFELLRHLANMEPTASFVCSKLIFFFLGDNADEPDLLKDMVKAWASKDGGNIGGSLGVLFSSKQFLGTKYRWDRLELPMESLVSAARALDGRASTINQINSIWNPLRNSLGQRLYYFPSPDGFPVDSIKQSSNAKYLERVKVVDGIFYGYPNYTSDIEYDVVALLIASGVPLDGVEKIADFLLHLLYQNQFTKIDYNLAVDFLSQDLQGNPAKLNPMAADYADRINHFATYVSSIPQAFEK